MNKKSYIAAVALVAAAVTCILAFSAFIGKAEKTQNPGYLRIHIRANGNGAEDQAVKYMVRDGIIAVLTPVLAECKDASEAEKAIKGNLSAIGNIAESVLQANGFEYGARVEIREEEFPTRIYDGKTLPGGVYRALIVELGEGTGDNWWCVAFPPLCFVPAEDDGSGTVKYRSKILEIIREFFSERSAVKAII